MKTRKFKMFNVLYLVCFALFLSLTASFFATSYTSTLSWDAYAEEMTYNSSTGVYEIYTAEQFAGFSSSVNSGTTYAGKTIRVMNNIDLKNKAITPVGTYSYRFQGTFDGQNSAFSNVNINQSGLFKYVENATVQNVVIDSGTIYSYSSIAEYSINSDIINCTNRAKFSTSTLAGGIVDDASSGSVISNCMNYGSIANSNNAGGIARVLRYSTVENCVNYGTVVSTGSGTAVGGIVGTADNATIKNCSNFGKVGSGTYYSSSSAYAGGIVGSASSSTISNCYNNSSVRAETESTTNFGVYEGGYAGGIVGYGSNTKVNNSYAAGSVYCMSANYDTSGRNSEGTTSTHYEDIYYHFRYRTVKSYNSGGIIGSVSTNSISNCGYSVTIYKTDIKSFFLYNKGSTAYFSDYDKVFVFKENSYCGVYNFNGSYYTSFSNWGYVSYEILEYDISEGKNFAPGVTEEYFFKGIIIAYKNYGRTSGIEVDFVKEYTECPWFGSWTPRVKKYADSATSIPLGTSIDFTSNPGTYSTSPLDYLGSDWVQHDYAGYVYNKIYW